MEGYVNGYSEIGMWAWTSSIWFRIGTGKCNNKPSSSIKCGKILP